MNPPDASPETTHLSDALLAATAEGTLSLAERDATYAHLADCAECRGAAVALREGVLAPVPAHAPRFDAISARILAALPLAGSGSQASSHAPSGGAASREVAASGGLPRWFVGGTLGLAAASLAFVVGIGALGHEPRGEPAGSEGALARLPAALRAEPGTTIAPPAAVDLGTTRRWLWHLETDKPVYRPGERVFARAVLLDAFDHTPGPDAGVAWFSVLSGRGEQVFQAASESVHGVAPFGWEIPPSQAGGRFTLAVEFPGGYAAPARLEFDVRDFHVPRIQADVDFDRKAYGPGDAVAATLTALRAQGSPPEGAVCTAVATVDGKEVARREATLDAKGACRVAFDLPKEIAVGDATLAVVIRDGGVVETSAKSIPVVLNRVALSLLPEGGDLVAGVLARVYFEARTPKDEPADVAGRVLDGGGSVVARFSSVHEGRGRFDFVPRAGEPYVVELDQPAGIVGAFPLPAVQRSGFSLAAVADRFDGDEPVRVAIEAPITTSATVGLYVRERELAAVPVRLVAGRPATVVLDAGAAAGVLRVTVFDAEGRPRAERLVLRRPARTVDVRVVAGSAVVEPSGQVRVDVETRDAQGRPVAAVVGVAATDDQVLTIPEPRRRAARLPARALLGAEVRELMDPGKYLGDGVEAARNTDLLLGTQGWRRFAFLAPGPFLEAHGDLALRAVGGIGSSPASGTVLASHDVLGLPGLAGRFTYFDWDDATVGVSPGGDLSGFSLPRWKSALRGPGLPGGTAPNPTAGAYFADGRDGDFRARTEGRRTLENASVLGISRGLSYPPAGIDLDGPTIRIDRGAWPESGSGGVGSGAVAPALARRMRGVVAPRGTDIYLAPSGATPVEPPDLPDPPWVREYAHVAAAGRDRDVRDDFTETVYWNPALVTGADGRASFAFDASDAVTTVRVRADAFTRDGALGTGDATVEVRRAFFVEPRLPLEVTAGDRLDVPVAFGNGTDATLRARLDVEAGDGLSMVAAPRTPLDVPARGSLRATVSFDVAQHDGPVKVRLRASAGAPSDDVTREVRVVPAGFPREATFGGVLEEPVEHAVDLPQDVVPGSVVASVSVYPTPLASLTAALERLLREPCGCFEQTSSSNYPNVMVLRYLETHTGVDPAIVARAQALLANGYRRLVGFECASGGYEWFGHDPGHEALTAYGVLEFTDMAKVFPVDAAMLARTRTWLLSRRDGKGGFLHAKGCCDTFANAPADVWDAYVVYALAEAGEKDLGSELARVVELARAQGDPYVTALAANASFSLGDPVRGRDLLDRLATRQDTTGRVVGAATSITRSGGRSLDVETTALAALAWLRSPDHVGSAEKAMRWLASACGDGRFGSTQATVLALKAIVAYDAARARTRAGGKVVVLVDGDVVGEAAFDAGREAPIVLDGFGARLAPGRRVVSVRMEDGSVLPYALTLRFHARTPASSPDAKVGVTVAASRERTGEGEPVDVAVTVSNRTAEPVPMVVAIVGLPGGLEVRADQLRELVKEGRVAAYETRGREVILYWRGLDASAVVNVPLSCIAAVPGRYTAPASRAYLYYTDEHKAWAAGPTVEIAPR